MKLLISKLLVTLNLIPIIIVGVIAVTGEYSEKFAYKILYALEDLNKKIKKWGVGETRTKKSRKTSKKD